VCRRSFWNNANARSGLRSSAAGYRAFRANLTKLTRVDSYALQLHPSSGAVGSGKMGGVKTTLRQSHLKQRKQLSAHQVCVLSQKAQQRVMALTAFSGARTVGLYAPLGNEVSTGLLCGFAQESGSVVAYPRIVHGTMEFVRFDKECAWKPGKFGILEPSVEPQRTRLCEVTPDAFDVVVVPGVAFDFGGNRLGYGKGFYDRFLVQCASRCVFVGLAYDFQLEDKLPREAHDIALDYVVTDTRCVVCPASNRA